VETPNNNRRKYMRCRKQPTNRTTEINGRDSPKEEKDPRKKKKKKWSFSNCGVRKADRPQQGRKLRQKSKRIPLPRECPVEMLKGRVSNHVGGEGKRGERGELNCRERRLHCKNRPLSRAFKARSESSN